MLQSTQYITLEKLSRKKGAPLVAVLAKCDDTQSCKMTRGTLVETRTTTRPDHRMLLHNYALMDIGDATPKFTGTHQLYVQTITPPT